MCNTTTGACELNNNPDPACNAIPGPGGGPPPALEQVNTSNINASVTPFSADVEAASANNIAVFSVTVYQSGKTVDSVDLGGICPPGLTCEFLGSGGDQTVKLPMISGITPISNSAYYQVIANSATPLAAITITFSATSNLGGCAPKGCSSETTATVNVIAAAVAVCDPNSPGVNQLVGCLYNGRNFNSLHSAAPAGVAAPCGSADNFSALDYDWGAGGPNGLTDNFSIRWKGNFTLSAGSYDFSVDNPDDGFRLFVDGTQISPASEWTDQCCQGAHIYRVNNLAAGPHLLILEYFENAGGSRIGLAWSKVIPPPTITFSANPTSVSAGGASTLTWSTANAAACAASASPPNAQWLGLVALGGNRNITNLTQSTQFTLLCHGSSGPPAAHTATVTVTAPVVYINSSVRLVNGSASFNLRDIKNGDRLRFRVSFTNTGNNPATVIRDNIQFSSNLRYEGNSYSCATPTAQGNLMRCAPVAVGTPGANPLSFATQNSLLPGDTFYAEFEASVVIDTTQRRELLTVRSQGTYDPGNYPLDTTYALLAAPNPIVRPDFHEAGP